MPGTIVARCSAALAVMTFLGAAVPAGAVPAPQRPSEAADEVSAVSGASALRAPAARRPNFVMILLDDATYRELPLMPKLQSLVAAHGTTFPNYFDSTSICCPARAGILSGQYATNNRVRDNHSAKKFSHNNQLASWLHGAGYQTSLIGKYLNEFPCVDRADVPKGWDSWQQVCDANDSQYNYTLTDNGRKVEYGSNPRDYMVDVLNHRTQQTLRHFSSRHQPFFVYVAPTVPHLPHEVPARYKATHVPMYPRPASFDEADMTDKPWLKGTKRINTKWPEFFKANEVPRMRMNLAVDDLIEASIRTLKQTHQLDNTIVMVLNDNGLMRGEHRLAFGKGLHYYEALNSGPLYVRGPGFPAGVTNPALVGNVDLAPTISKIAGARPRRLIDGVDIMPAVGRPELFANRVYFHYLPQWGVVTGVRVGDRYAFFQFHQGCCYAELYEYQRDPNHTEMVNTAAEKRSGLLVLALLRVLHRLERCRGEACAITMDERGKIGKLPT